MRTSGVVVALVALCACGRIGRLPDGGDPRDVSGNYDITYDNNYTLHFLTQNAPVVVQQTGEGTANFGQYMAQSVSVNLQQLCARPEVKCPTEVFWQKVAVEQPDSKQHMFALQQLRVIDDTVHTPDAGVMAESRTGLIDYDHSNRFLLGLGVSGVSGSNCAAIDVSWAGGRFSHVGETVTTTMEYRTWYGFPCDPDGGTALDAGSGDGGAMPPACTLQPVKKVSWTPGAEVDGIKDGKVAVWFAGGCVFGPFAVGTTFVLETGYSGTRTGNFDPPPYTPSPLVLPDGGLLHDGGVP